MFSFQSATYRDSIQQNERSSEHAVNGDYQTTTELVSFKTSCYTMCNDARYCDKKKDLKIIFWLTVMDYTFNHEKKVDVYN